jgi:hypothetical protein
MPIDELRHIWITPLEGGVTIRSYVPLTRNQKRQINRAIRNGTYDLFDNHIPPACRPGKQRMKGARQADARRKPIWEKFHATSLAR